MDQLDMKAYFVRTYDSYADDIYRFCVLKVSSKEQAQDITQEVFMRYWQQLRNNVELKNDRAFLYTIARNLIIDWYRKKKESSLDALTETGVEFSGNEHKKIEEFAQMNEVLAVIDKLDADAREVVLLRFVDGFTPKEIAAITGETANTVSVRLNRSVKKIQTLIHAQ